MTIDDEKEKPLDPATERVRRKMVRLLAVSIGIMSIGLMAVLGTVVYKATRGGTASAPVAGAALDVHLPDGAAIEETSLGAEEMLIRARVGGETRLYLVSLASGQVVASYRIVAPGAPPSQ